MIRNGQIARPSRPACLSNGGPEGKILQGRLLILLPRRDIVLKQDRARKTHEVLLDAAAGEFVRHGYAGANLKRIAVQIGMSKGALYAHFPSKEALATALTAPFDQAWRGLLQQADEARSDPLEALQCITFSLASRLRIDIRFRAGLQLVSEDARARGEVPTVIGDVMQMTTRLVRQAQQQGELRLTHAPEALSSLVVAATFGIYHTTSPHRLDDSPHEVHRIWQLAFPSSAACPPSTARTRHVDGDVVPKTAASNSGLSPTTTGWPTSVSIGRSDT